EKGRKNRKQKRKEKNTKKRKIPTSVHFLLQSKKFRNRKNPKEKESRSSSIHTTAAEITEQERRDHQAQALTNSLILPKFTKAKVIISGITIFKPREQSWKGLQVMWIMKRELCMKWKESKPLLEICIL
ncbi:hypothetical protein LINPERPRIM_LOCUS9044, partial [Linum perenne]